MNKDCNEEKIALVVLGLVLIYCFVTVIGVAVQRDNLKKEAISLGHAQYNSQTGQFQWITNKVDIGRK